ncbi:MAG TPA: hypothetical protein VFB82_03235 [Blastocatellia bacterium]|nr:hypothetical protein [Blastocatellia bacterium]
MVIDLRVNKPTTRILAILAGLGLCAVLAGLATTRVVAGLLTDQRTQVPRDLLSKGVRYAPNSAPLRARLAEAEMLSEERDLSAAEADARLAVRLSPWDYNYRMLLASIEEAKGDRASAEDALNEALKLAPSNTIVHWRLANVLLRQGKLGKSLAEFRLANTASTPLLLPSLDLVWKVSSSNLAAVQAITPDDAKSKIRLAQFLLQQSRAAEAGSVFGSIDPAARLGQPEAPGIIDALISKGNAELARYLWADTVSRGLGKRDQSVGVMWNGDFESEINDKFAQFDWTIGQNAYAQTRVNRATAHGGAQALQIDFTGRDTTRLDDEINQRFLVRSGARYKLEFFVKTENLVTPEGPRVVVTDAKSSTAIAASDPAPVGSNDWSRASVEFVAPPNASSLIVAIRRIPKFSYDNPTKGTVWFDDFSLTEQARAQ